jgi:hypothetical protein
MYVSYLFLEIVTLMVDGQEYGRVEPGSDGLRAQLPQTCAGLQEPGMAPFDDHVSLNTMHYHDRSEQLYSLPYIIIITLSEIRPLLNIGPPPWP